MLIFEYFHSVEINPCFDTFYLISMWQLFSCWCSLVGFRFLVIKSFIKFSKLNSCFFFRRFCEKFITNVFVNIFWAHGIYPIIFQVFFSSYDEYSLVEIILLYIYYILEVLFQHQRYTRLSLPRKKI